jgi:anti-sigma factor RsiW
MRDNHVHLSDQDLLLFADGELSSRRAHRVREHLAACWTCRARTTELEGAIADFVHLHQSKIDTRPPPPPDYAPRSKLGWRKLRRQSTNRAFICFRVCFRGKWLTAALLC